MRKLRLLTLLLMATILVPSVAHLLELPAKIDLDRESYFMVQGIYAGWAAFGIPIMAAILANTILAIVEQRRDRPVAAGWATAAAVLVAMSLVVFFVWVFPANQATANWTRQPEGWEALRQQWEWGHAANAVIVFAAFVATSLAVIRR